MTAAVTATGRRTARVGTLPRATPRGVAAIVDFARVALVVIFIVLTLAGLVMTCDILAGPVPAIGPQPGF